MCLLTVTSIISLSSTDTVIMYLAVVALLSFGAVFTFSALMKRFDSTHCFLETPFRFTTHSTGDGDPTEDNSTTTLESSECPYGSSFQLGH